MDLPFASKEFPEPEITADDILIFTDIYHQQLPSPTPQATFNYAWALVSSANSTKQQQTTGISLLHELYIISPERRRECLYYLALGYFKLAKYSDAKKYNQTLLKLEPMNSQALALRDLINNSLSTDGFIGMGIVGGLVIGTGLLLSALTRSSRK